jgi:gluconate 2-dehydrogenase gamma chain
MSTKQERNTLSRRSLLRRTSLFGGGLFAAMNLQRPLALAAMKEDAPAVLSKAQWKTVEAITGRIIPTDHQPGAIEANCVNFIDKALANEDAASLPDFLSGLTALDIVCEETLGKAFIELTSAQQDQLLAALAADTAKPWPDSAPAASSFFELLRALTIMGFMADPKYGGNADVAGWRVARYPGPRHHAGGYTAAQMVGEEDIITVWGEKM